MTDTDNGWCTPAKLRTKFPCWTDAERERWLALSFEDKLITTPDEVLTMLIVDRMDEALLIEPSAKLAYSHRKDGSIFAVGIYKMPLLLNEHHTFMPGKNFAPELLGQRLDANHDMPLIRLYAWISAVKYLNVLLDTKADLKSFMPVYGRIASKS